MAMLNQIGLWLASLLVMPIKLPTYLPSTYLCPTCLLLSTYYLPKLPIYLPTYLYFIYLSTYLVSTYILTYSLHSKYEKFK
jgi:hypothetical protein